VVNSLPISLPPIDNSPPQPNEIEVSIFGSRIGECILIHLPNEKWMIVDSCLHPESKEPVALSYLNGIGVDVANNVELIVITHWHDDHIQGISSLVSACHSARVCFSSAMLKEEFLTLISVYSADNSLVDRYTSGTREMANTLKELKVRPASDPSKPNFIVPVVADRTLYNDDTCSVISLSPSDKSYSRAIASFSSLIPSSNSDRKTLPAPESNDNSIVLWISWQNFTVLLGSDLEENRDEQIGWKAIINSPIKPTGQANLFKIPHHGSITGHPDDVWGDMVKEDALCLLTENTRGRYSIPTPKDVERIKEFTSNLYCASLPKQKKVKRNSAVERTLREMVKNRKILGGNIGQVQVRISNDGESHVAVLERALVL